MNLIHFSFSNAYIYSPITWLHRMQINHKIFIIFSFLCLVPFITFSYLLIITLTFLTIILTLKFRPNYYDSCFGILVSTFICILPYYFSNVNYMFYNTVKIYTPYQVYNSSTKTKNSTQVIPINSKTFIQLKIPEFMMQIAMIAILYSIILKTLLLTTMYEQIILSVCKYMKIDNEYLKKTIFISSFASQFLERMTNRISIVYISIKLRNINLILCNNKLLISSYITTQFLNHLKNDIYKVSSVLYSREFSDKNFEINTLQNKINR